MNKFIYVLSLFILGCEKLKEEVIEYHPRSFSERVGTVFTPLPNNLLQLPRIKEVPLPEIDSVDAIWGATGRDDEGNIYIGMSSHGGDYGSAYLYQLEPKTERLIAQSDVITQLKLNNVYRNGMRQNKLHSKFYQADDGYIYFSSFDEGGEAEGINPTWGGNLWRKRPHDLNWEHLLATEEALVAVNTNGRYVYALGYWNHVLYQYDIKTSNISRITVGSVKEHVTRNFLVDELGHAYIPELVMNDFNEIQIQLVEFDEKLNKVGSYFMPSYKNDDISSHHGIVAYTTMRNGDIYFTTADGGLYQISPFEKGEQKLRYKGMMHPEGEAYIAFLSPVDGINLIRAISKRKLSENKFEIESLSYEVNLNLTHVKKLPLIDINKPLIYGSNTRSNNGDSYMVGWKKAKKSGYSPLLLRIGY